MKAPHENFLRTPLAESPATHE